MSLNVYFSVCLTKLFSSLKRINKLDLHERITEAVVAFITANAFVCVVGHVRIYCPNVCMKEEWEGGGVLQKLIMSNINKLPV